MSNIRQQIVEEARTWIGTPFVHQHRTKGVAVDCAGLVIGVARSLGLVPADFDFQGYSRLPDATSLVAICDQFMERIGRDQMQSGDLLAVRFDQHPQHFGLLADYPLGGLSIIHAASRYGRVLETRLIFGTSPLAMKFVTAYRLPGVV